MKNVAFRLMVGCENLQLAVTAGGPSALRGARHGALRRPSPG